MVQRTTQLSPLSVAVPVDRIAFENIESTLRNPVFASVLSVVGFKQANLKRSSFVTGFDHSGPLASLATGRAATFSAAAITAVQLMLLMMASSLTRRLAISTPQGPNDSTILISLVLQITGDTGNRAAGFKLSLPVSSPFGLAKI